MRKPYEILLTGVDADDLSLTTLRELCDLFVEGAQRSARLAAEGRSLARGAQPAWIAAVADLRMTKLQHGSLDMAISAPALEDAAPEIFAGQSLYPFMPVRRASTAFDLFLDAAEDAVQSRQDSERLDAGILELLTRSGPLFRGGCTLSVSSHGGRELTLDAVTMPSIKVMADQTPASRVGRVQGTLDTLTMSTKNLALRLTDGRVLRGFSGGVEPETLRELLGHVVVVEGVISYKPSGEPLRIEVDSATLARPADELWSMLPRVEPGTRTRVPSPPSSSPGPSLSDVFGKWPGDETDDALIEALREMS